MNAIQLLQITPQELANLIKEGVKPELEAFAKAHSERQNEGADFLTRGETCEFFKISKVTLHDWMKKGIVTHYKMGNRTYFNRAELVETLLSSNRANAGQQKGKKP